jgi:hypothetical protein
VPDGLATTSQETFAGGMFRAIARHLIPDVGTYDVENGLHDEDGSVYRRGGTVYHSNAAFGASLRWLTDVQLPAGQRTVIASPTAFGVLSSDDATPLNLGGAGLLEPAPSTVLGGVLYIGGGVMYGGSRKTADYSTGTVAVTNGSKTVTGTGTLWLANVDAGMLVRVAATGRYYRVASVTSDTVLVLAEFYEGSTATGQTYAATRLGAAATGGVASASLYCAVADKLVSASGNRITVSAGLSTAAATLGNWQAHSYPVNDYHDLPAGANVVALEALSNRVLAFTTQGVYVISNLGVAIVDTAGNPQRSVQLVHPDLEAWGPNGITAWGGGLVVAATDGVWLVDGVSSPVLLSRSVQPYYQAFVRTGYRPGQTAVYRGHLFLPIYDASNAMQAMLVGRLDRPVQAPVGTIYPWSRFTGHAGAAPALVTRQTNTYTPELLAAGRGTDARVVKLGGCFEPIASRKNDADGTTHQFTLETRDYRTGDGRNRNLVRRVQLRYELIDGGTDNPTIQAFASAGKQATIAGMAWDSGVWDTGVWGEDTVAAFTQLAFSAPEDDGTDPFVWDVARHTEYVRYRFICAAPAASLIVRSVTSFIRQSGKPF